MGRVATDNNAILIVAGSGRMLAQSARRAGLTPIVIDQFGDRDTRELAAAVQAIPALTPAALASALEVLLRRFNISYAVYGSGLELQPASLAYLYSRLPVCGNSPAICRRLQDKRAFFSLLKTAAIAHPEVSFEPPVKQGDWLIKPYLADGGTGIFFYDPEQTAYGSEYSEADSAAEEIYWQQYQHGEPMSVLFLADSCRARIIGFNRQWTASTARCPFAFSGVINNAELPQPVKQRLDRWLQTLTAEYALLGLNSLDFIWDGRRAWVLEINPRPSASMALYDDAFASGLLAAHLAACRGEMPMSTPTIMELRNAAIDVGANSFAPECHGPNKFALPEMHSAASMFPHTAYQILHAPGVCRIPEVSSWPDWVMDQPHAGTLIRAGHPICSIMARANTPRRAMALLRARRRIIFNTLNSKSET